VGDDCDGMEAFKHVVAELLEATSNIGDLRGQKDRAEVAQRVAELRVLELDGIISQARARANYDDRIHGVLVEVRDFIKADGNLPSPEMLARLEKAIEDTDPIPF